MLSTQKTLKKETRQKKIVSIPLHKPPVQSHRLASTDSETSSTNLLRKVRDWRGLDQAATPPEEWC